jgi:mRNA interferase MazF
VKQYEIWWANLPAPAGRRPVLLISRDGAYSYLNKFLAVEVSSTVRNISVEVPLGRAEGLPRQCAANCDNVRTISRPVLVKQIGQLAARRHVEVKRALGYALGWEELIEAD